MNNKYETRFLEIVNGYGFEQLDTCDDSSKINSIIINLFKDKCHGKVTALWGAGRNNSQNSHASVIINKYATYIQNLTCIIDSFRELQGKKFLGLPIITPTEIEKRGIEVIIVASKGSANSIIEDIKYFAPNCEYIDIYSELEQRGIEIYHEFFREASIYTHLFDLKETYKNEKNREEKQQCLKKLISAYLGIRDIYYAFHYIDEYYSQKFDDYEKYMVMKTEISELIQQIKDINKKRQGDIVLYLIDSLRAMDVYNHTDSGVEFKLLSNYLKQSAYFTNVSSTGVTTYESMMSIMGQKMPFYDNVYNGNLSFTFDNCEMLTEAEKKNYKICFYVPEEYRIVKETPRVEYSTQLYFTEKIWNLACDMAASDGPTFNFVYFPYELHFPLICGYHTKRPKACGFADVGIDDMSSFIMDQFESCKSYVDVEMEFYRTFFSEGTTTVIFSDHSQVVYDEEVQKPYFMYYNNLDRSVHATLIAKGPKIRPREIPEIFSMIDFNKIIISIIQGKDFKVPNRDIVQYQYYNIHNKQLREYAFKHGYQDYINGMNCFANKDYLYIITATGKEEVYRVDNHQDNIIDTLEGKKFSEMIKKNYDISFPEFILNNL